MNEDLLEMPLEENMAEEDIVREDDAAPETVPVPRSLVPHLSETAILLDIDGTLLDLMPTPREVWVPPGLVKTLNRLLVRTNGALALVSGRSLNDIDLIFAPDQFPAVGGHGAEMRIEPDSESVDAHAPPLDKELKRRLAAIAKLSPGILLEDKGRSAQRADRGAARQMRLRDQAFRIHQGERRARIDETRTFQGPPSVLHWRRRHRRDRVCDHA
jgi:trehalose 6-phosphate phosphatase